MRNATIVGLILLCVSVAVFGLVPTFLTGCKFGTSIDPSTGDTKTVLMVKDAGSNTWRPLRQDEVNQGYQTAMETAAVITTATGTSSTLPLIDAIAKGIAIILGGYAVATYKKQTAIAVNGSAKAATTPPGG